MVYISVFFLIFTIPVAATVYLMVFRIGRKWSTSNVQGAIGPIRDTINFDVRDRKIEERLKYTLFGFLSWKRYRGLPIYSR